MRYMPLDHREVMTCVKDFVWTKRNFRRMELTAHDVAEELGIARSSLLKVFKEEMEMSFLEYVNDCRLRYARKLIMRNHGKHTMEHIQYMSGFGTLNTFYCKYKKKYGELPSATDARNTK